MGAAAPARTLRITVDAAQAGQRLDQMLAASGAVASRARAQALLRDGQVRDSVFYSVLSCEWPVVKRRLQRLLPP